MRLLVLGGTKFLGRHVVADALDAGHEVTIFTRGRTNPDIFPDAEHVHGDRDGELKSLRKRDWDGLIDTSGYLPRIVRQSAELLRDAVARYVFVSSIAVYADLSGPVSEISPVERLVDPASEDVGEHYGALKAACERVIEEVFGARSARVRAGSIVGPHDHTGRFTYWPRRIAAGGEVLAPGDPESPLQFVDARDLAKWLVRLALDGPGGTFNATGPAETLTMGEFLERARDGLGADAEFTWIDERTLLDAGVEPWTELPLWLPGKENAGIHRADIDAAIAAGLTFRPLEETVRDTALWDRAERVDAPTLSRAKEAEVLARVAGK